MKKYIFKRILVLIPTVLAVSFLVFTLMYFAPNDPASIILPAGATQAEVDALNESLGFNKPFLVRYWDWVSNLIFSFDFGDSYMTRQPVADEILKRLPISVCLAFLGITGSTCIGVPLGVLSAVKQNKLIGQLPSVICIILAAFPSFWVGMLLMFWFSYKWMLLPTFGVDTMAGYVLPACSIAFVYAAAQMRHTRSSMLETIRQDYIRTARAKGATEAVAIWKHALRNALLPTVTIIGGNFGLVIGSAIVNESLFSIPGLGTYIINSINNRDVPAVLGAVTVLAAIYCAILLAVDLLYAVIDPRVKARYSR